MTGAMGSSPALPAPPTPAVTPAPYQQPVELPPAPRRANRPFVAKSGTGRRGVSNADQALIDQAVAEGRVTKCAPGADLSFRPSWWP